MPKTISQLPAAASATLNAVVAADNATGTLTEKVTLGQIAALASGAVTSVAGKTGAVTLTVSDVTNAVGTSDSRLTDSREWSASTVSQADAEAGTSTTRFAYTPLRVFQAVAAWWAASAAKTKLDGIATGATANSSDATLLSRANHTGTQAAGTITGLATVATTGAYSNLTGLPTLGTAAAAASTDFAKASHTHPLSELTQSAAANGQVPQWNGTAWVPANVTGGGSYTLPAATTTTLGGVSVPSAGGLSVTGGGAVSLASTAVTPGSYGGAASVATLTVAADGRLTAAGSTAIAISAGAVSGLATVATTGKYSDLTGTPAAYTLPVATASVLGGVKQGTNITIDAGGVISAAGGSYTLPSATTTTLGGVIVGTGLAVASGTVSVTYGSAASTACQGNDARLTDSRVPTSHAHGSITNDGKIGGTAGLIVVTGASGALTTASAINLAGGTAANPAITSTAGSADTGIYFPAADEFAVSTAGSERFVVTASGRTNIVGANDQHAFGVRRSSSGGLVYFGAKQTTATPDAHISVTGGGGTQFEVALFRNNGCVNFVPRPAPAPGGSAGDVYYDNATNRLRIYNGTVYSDFATVNAVVSPTALAASANDYSLPAGDIVRLSSSAAVSITGLAATASGDTRVLLNVGSFAITLANQSASSVAANRLLVSFGSDFIIAPNASALVIYDATTARWRVL
jgi:hypothetical protein